ncbi:MAG: hypothetical protein ACKVOJ_03160 [Sphingomonadaceae bacterium]
MTKHFTSLVAVSALALAIAAPAHARTDVSPYLEVGQVLTADLRGSNDVVTYSTIAAGVDASVSNARTEFQVNYRYERRIGYGDNIGDSDIHTGLARGAYQIIPKTLSIEAGAIATRARSDIRGAAPTILVGNVDNVTQVYSAYAGPTLTTNIGALDVGAAYRIGYTKAEAGNFVPAAGQPALDRFNDSLNHLASVSVGMESGVLPFGWTVSGAYQRDDASQLDQRFETKGVRGDVVVPVTPTLALVGGLGYEQIQASQRAPLLDTAGLPQTDNRGRFITDPASPRLLSYDQDGIYWDAGVLWRPSRRTTLEARVGQRFGGLSYTGSFSYQPSSSTAFQVSVYDDVETFGQQFANGLAQLPTSFATSSNPLLPQFGGCTFGAGDGGAGGCLNNVLQAVNSSVFRSRGVTALVSTRRGPWNAGIGAGYNRRTFAAPRLGTGFTVDGLSDESWFAQGQVGYQIDDRSNVSGAVYANYFDPGVANASNVLSTGATAAYQRTFGRRLSATAAIGLFTSKVEGFESDLTASALLGARYQF